MNRGSLTRANYGQPWFPSQKLTSDHDRMGKDSLSVQDNRQNFAHTGKGRLAKNGKDTSALGNLDKYFSREGENLRRLLALQIALFEVCHLFIWVDAVVAQKTNKFVPRIEGKR